MSGRDAVTEIPRDRWDADAMFDPNPGTPGKSYTRWGAFIEDVDRFDAAFFGISPREAISMDPQQRLLLEVAWEALEHAGIAPPDLAGTATGVFVGMTGTEYSDLALQGGIMADVDAYFASGVAQSVAAGRLAYAFDLHGPAVAVDTACSSSLLAAHMACLSLRLGECDAALAGGVGLMLSPDGHIMTSQARMMSFEGRCKTFDAAADGYVRGEGCGLVVLKRLGDAIADGDRILGGHPRHLRQPGRAQQRAHRSERGRSGGRHPRRPGRRRRRPLLRRLRGVPRHGDHARRPHRDPSAAGRVRPGTSGRSPAAGAVGQDERRPPRSGGRDRRAVQAGAGGGARRAPGSPPPDRAEPVHPVARHRRGGGERVHRLGGRTAAPSGSVASARSASAARTCTWWWSRRRRARHPSRHPPSAHTACTRCQPGRAVRSTRWPPPMPRH